MMIKVKEEGSNLPSEKKKSKSQEAAVLSFEFY